MSRAVEFVVCLVFLAMGVIVVVFSFHPRPGIPTPLEAEAWIGPDAATGVAMIFGVLLVATGLWLIWGVIARLRH